mmetsp:Transcript_15512/g.41690  ORF Transcript_15512/g.41690 Transcript_15512/m.41690 type:complete len:476 (-) Transcript_15512:255-1682(-)|eukprot:CAMPEP_0185829276 /NCGR_PEP_ID=MMETSP1353-20130828/154_1 /TAXON_ID=1077150 /ORGANISM="Erythrolobus australicus, Strain CCMP3124" /LENGTH=475 /DNA_ID=CAMNT_0028527043 /DNA_START=140 /DNA_END=1567 /DNA_ORIENTATION=+
MSRHDVAHEKRRGASRLIDAMSVHITGAPLSSGTGHSDGAMTSEEHAARRKAEKKAAKLDYFQLVPQMRASLPVKSRIVAMRKEPNTVLMSDVVSWLLEHLIADSKIEALAVGTALLEFGHLYAIDEEHILSSEFSDRPIPLRFALDDRDVAANITKQELDALKVAFESAVRPSTSARASRLVMASVGTSTILDAFTGLDATTWLLKHAGHAKIRSDAVRIGQLLLDSGLFHRVSPSGGSSKDRVFCDAPSALYRYGCAAEPTPPVSSSQASSTRGNASHSDLVHLRSEDRPSFTTPRGLSAAGSRDAAFKSNDTDSAHRMMSPRMVSSPSRKNFHMPRVRSNLNSPRHGRRHEALHLASGNQSALNLAKNDSGRHIAAPSSSANLTGPRTPAKTGAETPLRASRIRIRGAGLLRLSSSGRQVNESTTPQGATDDDHDGPSSLPGGSFEGERLSRPTSGSVKGEALSPAASRDRT